MSYSVLFESIPRVRNTRYESQKPFLPLPPSSPLPLGFLRSVSREAAHPLWMKETTFSPSPPLPFSPSCFLGGLLLLARGLNPWRYFGLFSKNYG
jgi:hypothetical protein